MDEILKVINTWLDIEKKSLYEMKGFPIVEAYHRGAVAYLTKVGLLLQRHLTSRQSRAAYACADCYWFSKYRSKECAISSCKNYPPPA